MGLIVRNEERNLMRCTSNLLSQVDFPWPIEILIVDNDSSDGTIAVAAQLVQTCEALNNPSHASRSIRILRTNKNNLGAARDLVVRESRHEWIAFTDADCVVPPRWLRELQDCFLKVRSPNPTLAAIGTANVPPAGEHPFLDALSLMFSSFLGHLNSPQTKPVSTPTWVQHLPTCSVLYPRQIVLDVGGFSNQFPMVCEDVDLSCRLRQLGGRFLKLSEPHVIHHHRPSYSSWSGKIFRYGWGQILAARHSPKHMTPRLFLPLFFLFTLFATAIAGLRPLLVFLLLYGLAILGTSVYISMRHRRGDLAPRIAALHLITHFSYSFGMLWGMRFLALRTAKRKT